MACYLRIAGAVLAVMASLVAGGHHWLLLQSVAWGGMLVRFSQDGSWSEAVDQTFDGEHPCSLCLTMREGQQREGAKPPLQPPDRMTDSIWVTGSVRLPDVSSLVIARIQSATTFVLQVFLEPATPPPKSA